MSWQAVAGVAADGRQIVNRAVQEAVSYKKCAPPLSLMRAGVLSLHLDVIAAAAWREAQAQLACAHRP